MPRGQLEADDLPTRSTSSVQRQAALAAWAGWLLLGVAVAFVLTLIANLLCWYDFFDRSDVLYAQRYAEDPKDYFEAKLLDDGMAYVGTCQNCKEDAEHSQCDEYTFCDPGEDVERLCREIHEEFVPLPVSFLDQDERLEAVDKLSNDNGRNSGHSNQTNDTGNRRLEEHDGFLTSQKEEESCHDKYRAWALVEFIVDDNGTNTTFKRCAYLYGTKANSKQSGYYGDLEPPELTFHSDSPETLWVWTQRRLDRCVVGLHMKMEDFVEREVLRDKMAIVGVLVSCCGLCFFGCFFTVLSQQMPNEAPYRSLVLCQQTGNTVERQYSPVR